MIRVMIADDHAVVREGLKRIVAGTSDLAVAGEAASGPELLAEVAARPCDVVLMDLAMPGLSGLEALHELRRRHPKLPILILSMYPADQYAVRTLKAGAAGYLNKGSAPEELISAIRKVAAGRRYLSEDVAQCLAAHVDNEVDKPAHERLSDREFQVLCLVAGGRSVTEIAAELGLSVKTVSTFRARVLEKLGLRATADLVRYALDHGLIH